MERYKPGCMTTHVQVNGEVVAVWDMPQKLGMTYEEYKQRQRAIAEVERLRTYCTIGDRALTLDEFINEHPTIELGSE